MGLENFRAEDVEPGDTYYKMEVVGEVLVEHPTLHNDLKREIKNVLPPSVNYTGESIQFKVPFEFTVRGHSKPQAWETSRDKLQAIQKTNDEKAVTNLVQTTIRSEEVEEKDKDW